MTEMEKVKQTLVANRRANDKRYADMRRAEKQPAINAYQDGQITADEYEELVGEPYAETLRDMYCADLERLKESMAVRVRNEKLTPEEYKAITGDDYQEETKV